MKKAILATKNPGKVREFVQILPELSLLTMTEAGLALSIEENGSTFQENALIKARAVYTAAREQHLDFDLILADDSGLEIDYFDKKPGIYSARWLGETTPYTEKNATVLSLMKDVPEEKRTARYVCCIAAITADGRERMAMETSEGYIGYEPSGDAGFGYDPIFRFPGLGSFADLTPEQKNQVSHRGKALRALAAILEAEL